jgi:hypothetical protein
MSVLFDDHPIAVSPRLAKALGLNAAVFLQQVHYWTENNKKNQRHSFKNGEWWVYNTVAQWLEEMPYLGSEKTFRRMVTDLKSQGVIVIDEFNTKGSDRTPWYRINYLRLNQICDQLMTSPGGQNDQPRRSDCPGQEVKMTTSITRDYTEITPETTTINSPLNPPPGEVTEQKVKSVSSRSKKKRLFSKEGIPLPKHDPEGFLRYVQAHPKQTHLASAANEWDDRKPTPEMVETWVSNVSIRAVEDKDWIKDNGAFVPNPAAYLKECHWLKKYTKAGSQADFTTRRITGQNQSDEEVQKILAEGKKSWEAKQAAMLQDGQNFSEYEGVTIDAFAI